MTHARSRPARFFLGEVEVIFGLWGVPLVVAITISRGWATATHYRNGPTG